MTMSLHELLAGIIDTLPSANPSLLGLTQDSRMVASGYLFIAIPGQQSDGRQHIMMALQAGAAAILAEAQDLASDSLPKTDIPIIAIPQLSTKLGMLASKFYHHPSHDLQIIGITGTNGKTSCAHFIAQALQQLGQPCGIIGTLGNGQTGHLQPSNHTTPDAITLQRWLAEFKQQGIQTVVMEVSSHGLVQGRTQGVRFHTAIFTNLTQDHLDYHGDLAEYARAKRLLFESPGLGHAIFNIDDPYGQQLAAEFNDKLPVYQYSLQKPSVISKASIYAEHIKLLQQGINAQIHTPWGQGLLKSSLLGRFNLANLLAALTALNLLAIPFDHSLAKLATISGLPGRMEAFGGGNKPLVVVDYAHTPDALKQVLYSLRLHCQGKLWCVFGCGGDRDRTKRPLMGSIAQRYADQVLITDDNPRTESPQRITMDILRGMTPATTAVIEHDRRRAIAHALSCAHSDDIVLIAGKGHEHYQVIGKEKIPFNDTREAKLLLEYA